MRPAYGIVALAFVALLPASLAAQAARPAASPRAAACNIVGVWELVSVTTDGRPDSLGGYRQRKIVGQGHYMWVGVEGSRDTLPLRTLADTLRAFRAAGGTGTYRLAGNSYTEQLELFVDPTMQGRPFPATCRTEGDRWYHTFPADSARQTVEVWRRIR